MLSFDAFKGQSAYVAKMQSDFARGSYVHAYLLAGPKGTGKKSVAKLCVMAALCRGEHKPCGVCGPCRRVLGETHPDVHTVLPPKGKQTIGVDALRETLEQVGVKSFEDGAKAILFPQAEKMTAAAQNCLLKTLEEPPARTVFFLITEQPGALLPTIVSRCRVVRFHPLGEEEAVSRLVELGQSPAEAKKKARMAEGCVGQALSIDEERMNLRESLTRDVFSVHRPGDVLPLVNKYKDDRERQGQVMDALEGALRDILLAQTGAAALEGSGCAPQAEAYARAVPLSAALRLSEEVTRARKRLGSNVAFASAFEAILLKVSEEYVQWPW